MDELLARVRVRLGGADDRRSVQLLSPACCGLEFRPADRTVRSSAHLVRLRPLEYRLLALLAAQPGHLFLRADIVEHVWNHRYLSRSRTLDTHVGSVRSRLALLDAGVTIQTMRGVGYRLLAEFTDC